jgi:GNAT superfamily N-acetyltransferase
VKLSSPEIVNIRLARLDDAAHIARLSSQLGYVETEQAILDRLSRLLPEYQHRILVAEVNNMVIAGWLHAFISMMLESPPFVEIGGIVVDIDYRRKGIGKLLIAAAEEWALANSLDCVRLRSNIIRPEAHEFYPAIGYTHTKTQKTYQKFLEPKK